MRSILLLVLVVGLLSVTGCATNSVVGQAGPQVGRYSGDVGVTGYGTNLTIKSGSLVPKLSMIGDSCIVTVEEGASVGRIEFWGNGNEVSVPEDMAVSIAQFGANRVTRRPRGQGAAANPSTKPA